MRVAVVAVLLLGAWLLWATLGAAAATPPSPVAPTAGEPARAVAAERSASGTLAPAPAREAVPAAAPGDDVPPPRVLRGRVRLASGEGTDASVRVGQHSLVTPADGVFAIAVRDGDDLIAWRAQYEPVQIANVARFADSEPLDVVLPGLACAIEGVLVTVDGATCKGWKVDLCGGTLDSGDTGLPRMSVEDLVASGRSADFASGFLGRAVFDDGGGGGMVLGPGDTRARTGTERFVRDFDFELNVLSVNANECTVGDDGSFCVRGLRRGHVYELRAWHEKTLQTVRSGPIGAPSHDYRFVVPPGEWRERVRGRVIDRRGAALADVKVRLSMRVHVNGANEHYETGQEASTGADGVFVFPRVPCVDLLLRFDGSGVASLHRELRGNEPADDLVVPLACQSTFRFEPAPGEPAPTAVRVLDAGGRAMRVSRPTGDGKSEAGERLEWPGRMPGSIETGDEATWLVLEGVELPNLEIVELRRIPLLLTRGKAIVVRG